MYEVSVIKGENPWKTLKKTINLLGGFSKIFPDNKDRILIKPNFGCHRRATTGATTDLRILASLIEMLQSQGYYNLIVGDGPPDRLVSTDSLSHLYDMPESVVEERKPHVHIDGDAHSH